MSYRDDVDVSNGPVVEIDLEAHEAWFYHDCDAASFQPAAGRLPLGDGGWTLDGPTTISPSILCRSCNTHGFWRDGRWEGV